MRTTVIIPDDMVEEAMKLSKIKSKTALIMSSLQAYIRDLRIQQLLELKGKIPIEVDIKKIRERKHA